MTGVITMTTIITPIATPISIEQLYLQEYLAVSHTVTVQNLLTLAAKRSRTEGLLQSFGDFCPSVW